jgi:hypothetical protein
VLDRSLNVATAGMLFEGYHDEARGFSRCASCATHPALRFGVLPHPRCASAPGSVNLLWRNASHCASVWDDKHHRRETGTEPNMATDQVRDPAATSEPCWPRSPVSHTEGHHRTATPASRRQLSRPNAEPPRLPRQGTGFCRVHRRSAAGPQLVPLGRFGMYRVSAGQANFSQSYPFCPTMRNARCEVALHPLMKVVGRGGVAQR